MEYFVYILQCVDGTLYCGSTNNLEKRIVAHNGGVSGARYTRGRRPVRLVYSEKGFTRGGALSREADIKRMSKKEKQALFS